MTDNDRIGVQLVASGRAALPVLMRQQMEWTRDCLAARLHTSWTPMLTAVLRDLAGVETQAVFVLATDFSEDAAKRAVLRKCGREVYAQEAVPVAAVLTAEAWNAPDTRGVEPRHNPERVEVIVAFGRTLDGQLHAMANLSMERSPDQRIVPGAWSAVRTEGVTCGLLGYFFEGFMERAAARMAERN
jgi:hypothetical protein